MAWGTVTVFVGERMPLSHPKPGRQVLMFLDANGLFWGGCIVQFPPEELSRDVPVAEMRHEPTGFESGSHLRDGRCGSLQRTRRRSQQTTGSGDSILLWDGVVIFCDSEFVYCSYAGDWNDRTESNSTAISGIGHVEICYLIHLSTFKDYSSSPCSHRILE